MITCVVYKEWRGGLRRAVPVNQVESDAERSIGIRFVPEHTETGKQVISLEPLKMKPFTRRVPDGLASSLSRLNFERGVCHSVHIISDDDVASLDYLDCQIETLRKAREELMEHAYRCGRPVRIDEARDWRTEK